MSDIVKKVRAAVLCSFMTPTNEITQEIVSEVQALVDDVAKYRGSYETELSLSKAYRERIDRALQICAAHGPVNPTVRTIQAVLNGDG